MKTIPSLYHRRRFPGAVISCAVRWYFRFQLSLRDIEELLFERGVIEPPRILWRLQLLREWSHEQEGNQVFPGSPGARSASGARTAKRTSVDVGGGRIDCADDRLHTADTARVGQARPGRSR